MIFLKDFSWFLSINLDSSIYIHVYLVNLEWIIWVVETYSKLLIITFKYSSPCLSFFPASTHAFISCSCLALTRNLESGGIRVLLTSNSTTTGSRSAQYTLCNAGFARGGYSQNNWVGVRGPLPKTLTLFFHFFFGDFSTLFMTWPIPYLYLTYAGFGWHRPWTWHMKGFCWKCHRFTIKKNTI